ncbi:DUF480 domain-containing protein [Exilibacterium tricleocarpae]|uniref:DUF480 domain-containing protein n=1 Tax=Exilibacterium tricleocarpae TaxID=2591008 RepID=A0A545SY55_9GAMM|nr:DUF480 domain-containing protein [Exilibacterium tricleocarpae]TQV69897.1 DUF480 domain-containing protein [Exilibacterium tricleocarpae]
MTIDLTLYETRVIGALLEKESTTPDQYPLSLNGLVSACNQKSNREPVLELDESTVQQTVDELVKKHLVTEVSGFGSRVTKLQHRFCNTEFSELQFTPQERGIVCVLLLRGPQTPGELRTRTNRLCRFADVQEVEATLQGLMDRSGGALVAKLPREPGRRESRYAHLFSGEIEATPAAPPEQSPSSETAQRLELLEQRLASMQTQIDGLREDLDQLLS